MNQKTRKQTIHWLKVAVIGIALGFALQFVRAWTEPTTTPPGGNVGAPINTGAQKQTKIKKSANGLVFMALSSDAVETLRRASIRLCIIANGPPIAKGKSPVLFHPFPGGL